MLTRLQVVQKIDPVTKYAYRQREEAALKEQEKPHGDFWHVSFHASQFPGDDEKACPRQAVYRMMDFPRADPINRRVRVAGVIGKAIEIDIVDAFDKAGILLSAPPDAEHQTGFELWDHWLTGSVDSVIELPGSDKPVPVEIKSAYKADVEKMKLGAGPKEAHVKQLKVQIALVRAAQQAGELWSDRELCDHGYVYYFSRDNPDDTAEYRIDHDENFFQSGLAQLRVFKEAFIGDVLMELNPGKRSSKFGHPHGWRWSYQPCQFCDFKKTCQLDFQQSNTSLSESVGVQRARLIRKDYDPFKAKQRVFDRWADDRKTDRITKEPKEGK